MLMPCDICWGRANDPAKYKFGSANMADAALLFCTSKVAACWLADVTAAGTLLVPLTAAETAAVSTAVDVGVSVLEVVAVVVVDVALADALSDVGVDAADVRRLGAPPLTSSDDVVPARRMVRNLSLSCTLDLSLNCGPSSLSMRMSDHTFLCPLYFLTPSSNARSSVPEKGRYLRWFLRFSV
jgi:hypothetical protein